MGIADVIYNSIVWILSGYLALTSMLANQIENLFPFDTHVTYREDIESEDSEDALVLISSDYTRGGAIPRILIEHAEYQEAAVGSGLMQDEPEATSTELSIQESITSSLVNVYCQYRTDEYTRTTTGTGFFISDGGVILTNAHVAQFLLLKDEATNTKCILRGGNPASPLYEAELLYISPLWINENASLIGTKAPKGTGERDYALLYASKSIDGTPLPKTFPSLTINTQLLSRHTKGTGVLAAGYPAESLYRDGVDALLVPTVASSTVGELYTFGSNYADIFSLSGSAVGEQGASGGPIVTDDGEVIGLIVTKGENSIEGERSLRALTLSYINRTIIEETGFSLLETTSGDLRHRSAVFNEILSPFLATILEREL